MQQRPGSACAGRAGWIAESIASERHRDQHHVFCPLHPYRRDHRGIGLGGGAGIQADLKTFSALGVYGASVITALTAQNTMGVQAIHDVPPASSRRRWIRLLRPAVGAVKIGMLSQVGVIETVAAGLDRHGITQIVLDPVMVATSGDRLLAQDAIVALREILIPRALLITPNLPEAAALLDEEIAQDEAAMIRQGEALLKRGARRVLIKGGHGSGAKAVDLLVTPEGVERLEADRIDTRNTHGTGCTLSAAIAAGLARGMDLGSAVRQAKAYLTAALAAADRLRIGRGHGPVHHFHAVW